jgi:hypothetical protein
MTFHYYLVHGQLMPKSALEVKLDFLTTAEQLSNPDLIINISQIQQGGGGGGGGPRGKFNKDMRRTPYNKKDGAMKPAVADPIEVASASTGPAGENPTVEPTPTDQTAASGPPAQPEGKLTRLTLEVTDEDYLLGVADLTGELMRLAINTLGQSLSVTAQETASLGGTKLPTPEERVQHILTFLRNLKSGFDGLALTRASPISKKMGAFKQSLNKIEMACYNVKVRGAEYPPEILRQMLMSGPDHSVPTGEEDDEE